MKRIMRGRCPKPNPCGCQHQSMNTCLRFLLSEKAFHCLDNSRSIDPLCNYFLLGFICLSGSYLGLQMTFNTCEVFGMEL